MGHPSIRPSIHPSVRPSVHPSIRPSIHPSGAWTPNATNCAPPGSHQMPPVRTCPGPEGCEFTSGSEADARRVWLLSLEKRCDMLFADDK